MKKMIDRLKSSKDKKEEKSKPKKKPKNSSKINEKDQLQHNKL